MTDVLAECVRVTKRFGHRTAVNQVSLQVRPGEIVGLLGANGAGKTTLIRMLLGLITVSEGEVRLLGRPPSRDTRRAIGYVPQGLGLYDDLTVSENMQFSRMIYGAEPSSAELPATLRPFAKTVTGELSIGLQRRAAFAEALAHRPQLLMLDEPTSGVDPLARARLWETIQQTTQAGAGALVTTHYMEEAEECTRLVVMSQGTVVAEGSAAEIVAGTRVVVVESDSWSDTFRALDEAGLPVVLTGRVLRVPEATRAEVERALNGIPAHLTEEPATLEEKFYELTRPAAQAA